MVQIAVFLLAAALTPALASVSEAADTTSVVAGTDGVVVYTGRYFAQGDTVELQRRDGSIMHYNHLARIAPGITPGVSVHRGQPIGEVIPGARTASEF